MGWLSNPTVFLSGRGGTLELADSGDKTVVAEVLRRLNEQFGAVVRDHLFRNLMGDTERERDYWYLTLRGREYFVMRCTAPEAPPGVCVMGPTGTRDDLAVFRTVAASFGVVLDRPALFRSRWWKFW